MQIKATGVKHFTVLCKIMINFEEKWGQLALGLPPWLPDSAPLKLYFATITRAGRITRPFNE